MEIKTPSFATNILEIAKFLNKLEKTDTPVTVQTICPLRQAINRARCSAPAVVVIDNLNLLHSSTAPSGTEIDFSLATSRLISEISALRGLDEPVLVIGIWSGNSENILQPFRKRGENAVFNDLIVLDVPSRPEREKLALSMMNGLKFDEFDSFITESNSKISEASKYASKIAQLTPGFVALDLKNLIFRAKMNAGLRKSRRDAKPPSLDISTQLANLKLDASKNRNSHQKTVTLNWTLDFLIALERIKPSQLTDSGFDMTKPDLSWNDIGGYNSIKAKLKRLVIDQFDNPQIYDRLKIKVPTGILLYGPSEWTEDGASGVNERVLSTLLNEMDGIAEQKGVIVIGTTNRPEKLDDALLRPGRLDHHIYVSIPTVEDRKDILDKLLVNQSDKLDTFRIATVTAGFTSADLVALVREAGYLVLRDHKLNNSPIIIEWKHIAAALSGALKGPLDEMFKKAFEINDNDGRNQDTEKEAAFWKSFGSADLTWGVGTFGQTMSEVAEMNSVLSLRPAHNVRGGGWWRPGTISDGDILKFDKFSKGKKV
ncbi:hypothetical protein HK100_001623 [Physocladia obscura]|uniref:ATPase AAA-type core domain-containing protein n=1 Tax=Physocladia obscura TaxID=109957 RepID=A0AAD5SWK3_9FUNG|nr:hypothetical protein HK100_001623 [Physocladia obscura]